ncbi:MAG: hypothetical protein LBQ81_03380 [Zoogloeaceae bacterium]|jgi:hypothetical protein|nr:hypothetical protein [Zoogloeaceae bacterium]
MNKTQIVMTLFCAILPNVAISPTNQPAVCSADGKFVVRFSKLPSSQAKNETNTGEPIMTNAQPSWETLEQFNQPDNFFAGKFVLDVPEFIKNTQKSWGGYVYIRLDGVHVHQDDLGEYYREEYTRPDSPFEYDASFNKNGGIFVKAVRFYGDDIGSVFVYDENGKIIKKVEVKESYLPVDKLRDKFIEERKIDIYDKSQVLNVLGLEFDEKPYYHIFVYTAPDSAKLRAFLLNGVTGDFLFEGVAFISPGSTGPFAYQAYKEYLGSMGKKP